MAGRSTTQVVSGSGDLIIDEDVGLATGAKMPVSKLVAGKAGVDGGDVYWGNPLPARDDLVAVLVGQNQRILEMLELIRAELVDVAETAGGVQRCRKSENFTITCSILAQPLLAANAARSGVIMSNNSTATLSIKYGEGASANNINIAAGGYWEMPKPVDTGQISGISTAANGTVYVVESYRTIAGR